MKIELKTERAEFKVDEVKGIITGYASTFGNIDSYGDVIEPGAFDKTLVDEFGTGQVKLLLNHNWYEVRDNVAIITDAKVDNYGLFIQAEYAIDDKEMIEVIVPRIKKGIIDAFSIGFYVRDARYPDEDEHSEADRFIKDIKMREISIITFGANDKAKITAVKTRLMERYPDDDPEPEPDYTETLKIQSEVMQYKRRRNQCQ